MVWYRYSNSARDLGLGVGVSRAESLAPFASLALFDIYFLDLGGRFRFWNWKSEAKSAPRFSYISCHNLVVEIRINSFAEYSTLLLLQQPSFKTHPKTTNMKVRRIIRTKSENIFRIFKEEFWNFFWNILSIILQIFLEFSKEYS